MNNYIPSRLHTLLSRLRGLFTSRHLDDDFQQELESHLHLLTEENIRRGLSPQEAERVARVKLGSAAQLREAHHDQRTFPWLESLAQDIRFALRMLRKNPGFTTIAVLTLALGIGANAAIFSVVQGVLLAPLPYHQPDRLVVVWENNPRFPAVAVSYPNFLDRQRAARSFERMAAAAPQDYDLASPGSPEHLDGKLVSSGYFATLGVDLVLGREFTAAEDTAGGPPVAIISNNLLKGRFGSAASALGKSIALNGENYVIVGVLPPKFQFWSDSDVYTPLAQADSTVLNARGGRWLFSFGRLRTGASISQAQSEVSAIQYRLDNLYPYTNRDLGITLVPLKKQIVGDVSQALVFLSGAVGLVLLIAYANVASLLLSRSAARRGEFAIRAALGASRSRVARQILTESVILSFVGGTIGVAFAVLSIRPLLSAVAASLPRGENVGVNFPVMLFALALATVVGILSGLVPALESSAVGVPMSLKETARSTGGSNYRLQDALVVVQTALTLVLLVGAGLLYRTIQHLWSVDPGFDAQHIVTLKVGVSSSLTKTPANTRSAYQQLIARIREIPGVQAADFVGEVPLRSGSTMPFWVGPAKPASLQGAPRLSGALAGPDYLDAMGIPLLRGRFFTPSDTIHTPCVVAIDSYFARNYFPDSDPIGQTISFGFATVGPCTIVGVVGHVMQSTLTDAAPQFRNQLYFPLYQDPDPWVADNYHSLSMMIRTPLSESVLLAVLKSAVYATGDDQPVFDVQTMHEVVSKSMSAQRFPMILLGAFAGLALFLASVGTYGVISYSVTRRIREIGIRIALGAERSDVFSMVIRKGLALTLTGLAIGLLAALALTKLLSAFSSLLYGVRTSDPATLAIVCLLMTGVALFASYIPARRATRVDPMAALRHQ